MTGYVLMIGDEGKRASRKVLSGDPSKLNDIYE